MSAIALGVAAIGAAATIGVGAMKNSTQKKMNAANIDNMKADQRLKMLNSAQKNALDYRVANAKTDTERLAIYEQTLATLGSSTISSTGSIYAAGVASKSQQNYLQKSVILAGGIMLAGGTIAILRNKKS
jgi:hypothetical protein